MKHIYICPQTELIELKDIEEPLAQNSLNSDAENYGRNAGQQTERGSGSQGSNVPGTHGDHSVDPGSDIDFGAKVNPNPWGSAWGNEW